jgi:hypothetical protein
MIKSVVKVLPGSPALQRLFAPDPGAARRFIEFFTAKIRNLTPGGLMRVPPSNSRSGASVKTFESWPIIEPMHVRPI